VLTEVLNNNPPRPVASDDWVVLANSEENQPNDAGDYIAITDISRGVGATYNAVIRRIQRQVMCGLGGGHEMEGGQCSRCGTTYLEMAEAELREICPTMFEDPLDTEYHRPSRCQDDYD
jgi:hypothetical protein